MLPVLFGLFSAMTFGLVAHGIYGTDQIINHGWIDMVFWSLIGTGAAVSLINIGGNCLPCRMTQLVHSSRLSQRLCKDLPCGS